MSVNKYHMCCSAMLAHSMGINQVLKTHMQDLGKEAGHLKSSARHIQFQSRKPLQHKSWLAVHSQNVFTSKMTMSMKNVTTN